MAMRSNLSRPLCRRLSESNGAAHGVGVYTIPKSMKAGANGGAAMTARANRTTGNVSNRLALVRFGLDGKILG